MKQLKIYLLVISIFILIGYSSEISFMPNFKNKVDKWHLFFPMFSIGLLLLIAVFTNIFLILRKQAAYASLLYTIILIVFFLFLNNIKDEFGLIFGYLGVILLLVVLVIQLTFNK